MLGLVLIISLAVFSNWLPNSNKRFFYSLVARAEYFSKALTCAFKEPAPCYAIITSEDRASYFQNRARYKYKTRNAMFDREPSYLLRAIEFVVKLIPRRNFLLENYFTWLYRFYGNKEVISISIFELYINKT